MSRHRKSQAGPVLTRFALFAVAAAALSLVSPLGIASAGTTPAPGSTPLLVTPTPTDTATPTPTATDTATPTPAPTTAAPTATVAPTPTSTVVPITKVAAPKTNQMPRLQAAGAAMAVTSPHGPYDMKTDSCASCHRAHTAKNEVLLASGPTESTLCLTCHDGTGSNLNVSAEYTALNGATNNAATRSFYYHDVSAASSHVLGSDDEFKGVLNRHAECGDCHDPHQSSTAVSSSDPVVGAVPATDSAWTASGRIAGSSGVSVTNGSNGAAPIYTFLNGNSSPITFEYQLCLKCHSGYTTLLAKDPAHPSRDQLDAGVEFNPANLSFHPVEAAGTNRTAAMAASLSGSSAYKVWNLSTTSTVRCTNCHASPIQVGQGTAQGADSAPHASPNRGILLAKYEDRQLAAAADAFVEGNFALCFMCHADAPFTGTSMTATNFTLHNKHVAGISGNGNGGRDIDVLGAGQGNAICAECHFRPHSTATTTGQWSRLVAFAPNVQGILSNPPSWRSTGTGSGSCTLRCHEYDHINETYSK